MLFTRRSQLAYSLIEAVRDTEGVLRKLLRGRAGQALGGHHCRAAHARPARAGLQAGRVARAEGRARPAPRARQCPADAPRRPAAARGMTRCPRGGQVHATVAFTESGPPTQAQDRAPHAAGCRARAGPRACGRGRGLAGAGGDAPRRGRCPPPTPVDSDSDPDEPSNPPPPPPLKPKPPQPPPKPVVAALEPLLLPRAGSESGEEGAGADAAPPAAPTPNLRGYTQTSSSPSTVSPCPGPRPL